ncbi:MAG: hypothetical protein V1798_10420 [Pseudomonadota bacterium]
MSVVLARPFLVGADPVWLGKSPVDIQHFLAPPPALGSPADRADLDRILRYQVSRTEKECERARSEVSSSLKTFFGPPYGPLTSEEVTKWAPFFEKIHEDESAVVRLMKARWNRPRPYEEDPKIAPCVPRAINRAYPSGHTTLARVFAKVLSRLKPEQAIAFEDRADQIAEDRILGGVHYPTDIQAGKRLGDEIARLLLSDAAFQKELAGLKAQRNQ